MKYITPRNKLNLCYNSYLYGGYSMARTMVIGLTESGTRTKVNEDSFSCGDRVYPDMITGSEEQTRGSSDYTQIYIVTQGFGGSGAGDLAGRIIQRVSKDFVAKLDDYKHPELDFAQFSRELIKETHYRVLSQIVARAEQDAGASFAMLLIDANTAYILNVGDTKIHLFRNDELYSLMDPADTSIERYPAYIGDRCVPFEEPRPNTMKRFELATGDIILLASEGFHTNFHHTELAEDIKAPDAFAANIRLAQLHSRQADNTENGTVLAIKIRDLVLEEPDDSAQKNVERFQKYYGAVATADNGASPMPARGNGVNISQAPIHNAVPPQPSYNRHQAISLNGANEAMNKGDETMNGLGQAKKMKKRSNWKTFGWSLLIGFLVGMAVILVVWFTILR